MKRLIVLFIFLSTCLPNYVNAQTDSVLNKAYIDKFKKAYSDSVKKLYADSIEKIKENDADAKLDLQGTGETPKVNLIIVISFFLVMIILIVYFFNHLKDHRQRIGYQSIKLIGLILIFPGICILAIVGGAKVLSGETLAVLLGTIAGYVLSRDDDTKESTTKDTTKLKDEDDKKGEEQKKRISELEDKIESIKQKNPNLIE